MSITAINNATCRGFWEENTFYGHEFPKVGKSTGKIYYLPINKLLQAVTGNRFYVTGIAHQTYLFIRIFGIIFMVLSYGDISKLLIDINLVSG